MTGVSKMVFRVQVGDPPEGAAGDGTITPAEYFAWRRQMEQALLDSVADWLNNRAGADDILH